MLSALRHRNGAVLCVCGVSPISEILAQTPILVIPLIPGNLEFPFILRVPICSSGRLHLKKFLLLRSVRPKRCSCAVVVHPAPPNDPRQPQTLVALRNPRQIIKRTSDAMACSPAQRVVALSLPLGPRQISKRTFDAMACSPAQRVVALSLPLEPRFETMPRANPGSAVTSI